MKHESVDFVGQKTLHDFKYESEFYIKLSTLLQILILFSGILIIIGILLASVQGIIIDQENLTKEIIFREIVNITPIGFIFIGIISLLFTPVLYVISTFFLYLKLGNIKLLIITSIVFLFMFIGILLGIS